MLRLVIILLNFGLHFLKCIFFQLECLKSAIIYLFFIVYFGVTVAIFGLVSLF